MSDDFKTRAALRQRLLTVPGLPAGRQWENEGYDPVPGTPWLREQLMPAGSVPASFGGKGIGDGLIRDDGLWQITLFYPAGQGTKEAELMAKAVCSAFRPGLSGVISYDGQNVICSRAEKAKAIQEPDWYGIPVTIRYYLTRPNT